MVNLQALCNTYIAVSIGRCASSNYSLKTGFQINLDQLLSSSIIEPFMCIYKTLAQFHDIPKASHLLLFTILKGIKLFSLAHNVENEVIFEDLMSLKPRKLPAVI